MTETKTETLKRLCEEIITTPYSEMSKQSMVYVVKRIRETLGTYEENQFTACTLWCHCNSFASVYQKKTMLHEIDIIRGELYRYTKSLEQ